MDNLCITCKRNLGDENPRQYCGKTHCDYKFYYDVEEDSRQIENVGNKTDMDMYLEIKNIFTPDFYSNAKIQFSDICSLGDGYINDILDVLNDICNKKIEKDDIYENLEYITYIYDFYKNVYLVGAKPDAYWAD